MNRNRAKITGKGNGKGQVTLMLNYGDSTYVMPGLNTYTNEYKVQFPDTPDEFGFFVPGQGGVINIVGVVQEDIWISTGSATRDDVDEIDPSLIEGNVSLSAGRVIANTRDD